MKLAVAVMAVAMWLTATSARAQDDPEYRMEIGGGAGVMNGLNDFNGNLTRHMQPAFTATLRYCLSPYMALALNATTGKIKGSSADVETYYPAYATTPYTFSRTLTDVSAVYEYNFWPYGTGRDYRGARRLTPYLYGGVGATMASGSGKSVFTANMPLGVGIKYKAAERVNIIVRWAVHFSLSDKLDGVKDPYEVKSSGLFKNTDCYSGLTIAVTYSFLPKCKTCNKDDF